MDMGINLAKNNIEILESVPDAIVIVNSNGRIIFVNSQAEKVFGYNRDELTGKPVEILVPERLRGLHVGHRSDYYSRPAPRPMGLCVDIACLRKDGSEFPADISLSPLDTDEGFLVISDIRDITERKEAEEEIKRLNEDLERRIAERTAELKAANMNLEQEIVERKLLKEERDLFFVLSLDLQCIAGFDGYFKQLNPGWEKALGWKTEELLAKPYIEFVHPEDRSPTSTEAQRLSFGKEVMTFENRYLCKDGSYKWLQWNAFPSVERQVIYATARDITERKEMEEEIKKLNKDLECRAMQLEVANKELEAFSYSVSHDLRAPLRSMDGFSQALLEEYTGKLDDQGKDYLGRIRAASQRMAQLIDDMLNLSRVTRSEMHRERVDMGAVAQSIAAELRRAQPERKAEFVVSPGLYADGDAHLLRIALENLLRNAWKFSGKKPEARIEFGVKEYEGRPAFFVRDNGAGFDMTYAGKLFGVFQRLHGMKEFPGTGIGLSIVMRIIHRHGGRIWAEGEVEKGATFYFTL